MDKQKQKAAALAAVASYIKTEEEIISAQLMSASPPPIDAPSENVPRSQTKVWSLSGRQTQSHMRSMMQMKAFH